MHYGPPCGGVAVSITRAQGMGHYNDVVVHTFPEVR